MEIAGQRPIMTLNSTALAGGVALSHPPKRAPRSAKPAARVCYPKNFRLYDWPLVPPFRRDNRVCFSDQYLDMDPPPTV
jgi:hypothetical protein